MSLFDVIEAVVMGEDDGEDWLRHPDPDTSYLMVGPLADAICDAVNAWLEAQS